MSQETRTGSTRTAETRSLRGRSPEPVGTVRRHLEVLEREARDVAERRRRHEPAEDLTLRLIDRDEDDEPRGAIFGGVVAAPAFAEIAKFDLQYLEVPPDALWTTTTASG